MTVAVAESILLGSDLVEILHDYFHRYPQVGFGGRFIEWARLRRREPYNSWGNGSAMRVSPVGFAYDKLDDVMQHAERTAAVTHNHPQGIRGAQATAVAIYLARNGSWGLEEQRPLALGHFADSMVPLHGYRTVEDLRSTNELQPPSKTEGTVYCGPGLWFNRKTSRIHLRLAHHGLRGW